MTCEEFVALVLSFPGVQPGLSYGHPSYLFRGSYFTSLRGEDPLVTLQEVSFDEREMLIEAEPEVFFVDDHHRPYRMVQARLARLSSAQARGYLERRWRAKATKAMIRAFEVETSAIPV